jgi:hypothetical protein
MEKSEQTPSESRKETKEEMRERIAGRVKNRLSDLLEKRQADPIELPMEEQQRIRKEGTPEEREKLEAYEHTKFRTRWFSDIFSDLHLALDQNFLPVENREKVIEERNELLEDFERALGPDRKGKITPELVQRADALLKKVLSKE